MGKVNESSVIELEMPTDEEEEEGRRKKVGWGDGDEVRMELAQPRRPASAVLWATGHAD